MAPRTEQDESQLTPAEWKVMKVVWRHREHGCAARDVYTETAKTEGWAPNTTKTVIRRLMDKGQLKARQVGNSYLYEPAGGALAALLAAADQFMSQMLEGTTGLVISHMLEKSRLTDEELARLRRLIDEQAGQESRKESDQK